MLKSSLLVAIRMSLVACGTIGPAAKFKQLPAQTMAETRVAEAWHAPLPHHGDIKHLSAFWGQYDDGVLLQFIKSAQEASVNIATARTRIAEAKSNRVATRANTLPNIDGTASATRAVQQPAFTSGQGQQQLGGFAPQGATETYQVGLQAAWEVDLFGTNKLLLHAAKKQWQASKAGWHEARVSVAAEVGTAYFNQRFCQLQLVTRTQEVTSLTKSLSATEASVGAGFLPASSHHLAVASLANAKLQLNTQQTTCDIGVKELVSLTALTEEEVRRQLASADFIPNVSLDRFTINALPANIIKQRPDVYNAEAVLINAATEIAKNTAAKYPSISLNGSIGWMWLSGPGFKTDGKVWSLGPLSITLPLYDGGKRQAKLEASEVAYEESAQQYRSTIRNAVKEVEVALVNLHSIKEQQADLNTAVEGYQSALKTTEIKVKAGFANLIELEESRRLALQSQLNRLNVQQASYNAWIALYRAVGGGWDNADQIDPTNPKHQPLKNSDIAE